MTVYIWWFPCQKYRIHTVYLWFWPTLHILHVHIEGAMYIRCIHGMFGRRFTKWTVMHGVYRQFWPTLRIMHTYQGNHIHLVYTRSFWQENHQTYGITWYIHIQFWPDLRIRTLRERSVAFACKVNVRHIFYLLHIHTHTHMYTYTCFKLQTSHRKLLTPGYSVAHDHEPPCHQP
jgi:hypothetical protein